jgi:hypothetical protein
MMRSQAILHRNARIEESSGIVEGVGEQASELLCGGNALLDATTPFRDYFRVADHPSSGK